MIEIICKMSKRNIKSIGIKLLNKKQLFTIFLIVVFCSLSLSSCRYLYNKSDILVEYQVAFAKSGSRFNEIELVDKDDYGRELYKYKSGHDYANVFRDFMGEECLNAPVLMYIIIQKKDSDFIYCYDDFCYSYVTSFGNNNSEVVNSLKETNDWGKTIVDENLTALSVDVAFDNIIEYKEISIEKRALEVLGQMLGCSIEQYYLDAIFLEDATPIFVLREVINREKHEFGKSYVFNIDDERLDASYFELSDDINKWNEEIHDFKTSLRQQLT